MLLYYQPFFFCVSHSNTPQEIGLGQFFPLQERIYLLTKFYSQVTSQKSIQLEYERGTVAQGQGVMTAAQGSSHAFGRGRDMANSQSREAREVSLCQLHRRSLMSVTIAAGLENPQ